jgi:hypothetical protein
VPAALQDALLFATKQTSFVFAIEYSRLLPSRESHMRPNTDLQTAQSGATWKWESGEKSRMP